MAELTEATAATGEYSKLKSPDEVQPKGAKTPQGKKSDIDVLLKMYKGAKARRSETDKCWDELWEFYKGKQNKSTGNARSKRPVVNIIRPTVQTVLPIMTDTSPSFGVVAKDPTDFAFAELMSEVLERWWKRRSMNHVMVETIMDALVTGYGILKVLYNPKLDNDDGDVEVVVVDPKHLYYADGAVDIERHCPWVCHEFYKSRGELFSLFTDKREEIDKAKASTAQKDYNKEDTRVNVVSPIDRDISAPDNEKASPTIGRHNDKIRVLEFWLDDDTVIEQEKINQEGEIEGKEYKKKYPKGRVVTVLPDTKEILQDTQNPRMDGEKPFIRVVDTLIPRSFDAEGEAQPLMDVQRMLNKSQQVIMDWLNLMSNPCWVVDNDSGVDPNMLTNQMGQIITKVRNTTVTRMDAPGLPPQVFEHANNLMRFSDMVSGVQDVTQGRKPTGITAAEAIEELQEAAQTRIRLKERNLHVSLTRLGHLVLSTMLQEYTEPRVIQMTGRQDMKGVYPPYKEFYIDQQDDGGGTQYTPVTRDIQYDEMVGGYVRGDAQMGQPTAGVFELDVTTGTSMPYMKEKRGNQALNLYDRQAIDQEALLESLDWPKKDEVMQRMQEQAQQQPQQGAPVQ